MRFYTKTQNPKAFKVLMEICENQGTILTDEEEEKVIKDIIKAYSNSFSIWKVDFFSAEDIIKETVIVIAKENVLQKKAGFVYSKAEKWYKNCIDQNFEHEYAVTHGKPMLCRKMMVCE